MKNEKTMILFRETDENDVTPKRSVSLFFAF